MYACMTPVGFDTSDKFENHCTKQMWPNVFQKCEITHNFLLYTPRVLIIVA